MPQLKRDYEGGGMETALPGKSRQDTKLTATDTDQSSVATASVCRDRAQDPIREVTRSPEPRHRYPPFIGKVVLPQSLSI